MSAFTNRAIVNSNLADAHGVIAAARSGLMTGIAADADVYLLRNVGARPFNITMVRIRWVTTTAFTSSQCLSFRFSKVYSCTAVHTGGSPVTILPHWRYQGDVQGTSTGDRVAATTAASTVNEVALTGVISSTAAITTAPYTSPSASEPEIYPVSSGSTLPAVYEDWQPRDGLPLVLESNTGLLGQVGIALGAGGVGRLYVGVDGYYI